MTCSHIKPDGERCRAYAVTGAELCNSHHPDLREARDEGRRRGGRVGAAVTLPIDSVRPALATVADVATLLAETIHHVRIGALDVKTANCLGFLASTLVKTLEVSEIEKRVDELVAMAERNSVENVRRAT